MNIVNRFDVIGFYAGFVHFFAVERGFFVTGSNRFNKSFALQGTQLFAVHTFKLRIEYHFMMFELMCQTVVHLFSCNPDRSKRRLTHLSDS